MNKSALMNKYVALNKQSQGIMDMADAETRNLTSAELDQLDALNNECDSIMAQIDALGGIPNRGRQTAPQQPMAQAGHVGGGRMAGPAAGNYSGFKDDGEFFQAVRNGSARGTMDPRLIQNAPTTSGNESSGPDGGYLVPPQFRQGVSMALLGETSLAPYCATMFTPSNTYVIVQDVAPAYSTSGIQANWRSELGLIAQSKPALKDHTQRLDSLSCLIPVSEELLEDAPSLNQYLQTKVASIFTWKLNFGIVQGPGTGEPLGILNSPALIQVDKEAGQDAGTIVFENIVAAWSRLAPGSANSAIWLAHPSVLPQLLTMTLGIGTGGTPAFMPAGGLSNKPYDALMGRQIVFTEACEPLGDRGDLILFDGSQYQLVMKSTGIKSDVSFEVFFEYNAAAFRFILRVSGAPLWPTVVAARTGSGTYSPYICLPERA